MNWREQLESLQMMENLVAIFSMQKSLAMAIFKLTPTPTRLQTISNESQLLAESLARPPAGQLHSISLPAIVDGHWSVVSRLQGSAA